MYFMKGNIGATFKVAHEWDGFHAFHHLVFAIQDTQRMHFI